MTAACLQIPRAPFILHAKRSAFILFIFPRAIDLILDAIIGYSLSGSPRGAEGRGEPETKWSLLFPASYNKSGIEPIYLCHNF
ncbi:MAG: hypothetical protein Q8N45_04075 [Anaerolineales bacterium]|nr:hypothetical protein [Anaerolineales bacterium]MDP2975373.1 hypothetical protein [Anaerolineales bacterium]MDP3184626.1 hypothetical protein [Anaerolineales bacterium]